MVNQLKKTVKEHPRATVSLSVLVVLCIACAVGGWVLRGESNKRLMGYKPNPIATRAFNATLGRWSSLRNGAPALFREDLPKDAPLYKYMYAASEESGRGKYHVISQEIGDCVSHAYARAVECALAVQFVEGRAGDWWPVSPESVYAGRIDTGDASWSDGWYGSSAARAVKNFGVLFKRRYDIDGKSLDLTKYSGSRAKEMGARGLPKWIYAERAKHCVREVALVTTIEEAKAAIANGYPIAICSNVGFEPVPTQRDQNGVAQPRGTWYHAMCICGYHTLDNGSTIFVNFNSWGERGATTGPGGPHDIPAGAFGITEKTLQRILSQGDSYAVSGPNGFEPQELDFSGWGTAEVQRKREQYVAEQEMRLSL